LPKIVSLSEQTDDIKCKGFSLGLMSASVKLLAIGFLIWQCVHEAQLSIWIETDADGLTEIKAMRIFVFISGHLWIVLHSNTLLFSAKDSKRRKERSIIF